MIWPILTIALIIIIALIILAIKKVSGKIIASVAIIGIIICALIFGFSLYKTTNTKINSDWYLMVERSNVDGGSNKVYFYSDNKVVVVNAIEKYNFKLEENIKLDEVYNYIKTNGNKEYTDGYKVTLNKDSSEIRYISNNDEQLKTFLEVVNKYISIR